ncbi:hypothetical protein DESA109040_08830 [Deinococcus saxicola]
MPSSNTSGAQSPRYPLKPESTWTISGLDQNNNVLRSKITLTAAPPRYRSGVNWYYDGDNGYVNLYEVQQGDAFSGLIRIALNSRTYRKAPYVLPYHAVRIFCFSFQSVKVSTLTAIRRIRTPIERC